MNFAEYAKIQADLHESRVGLNKSKSHDYANTEDMLANFKRIGKCIELLGINKLDGTMLYCSLMILMKLDRITNLIGQGKTPMNESVRDNFCDLENYTDLMYANLVERAKKKNENAI